MPQILIVRWSWKPPWGFTEPIQTRYWWVGGIWQGFDPSLVIRS